jgi:methionyl-tRNA synthetase
MTMTGKYRGGIVPEPGDDGEEDERLRRAGEAIFGHVDEKLEKLAFNDALAEIWEFIHAVNRYVDVSAPWALAKQGLERQLDNVLFNSLESLRVIALLIAPFMPRAAEKMWERLGYTSSLWEERLPGALGWGLLPVANKTTRAEGLFPRKLEEKE